MTATVLNMVDARDRRRQARGLLWWGVLETAVDLIDLLMPTEGKPS